jgi:excisionase family DNA binding protein
VTERLLVSVREAARRLGIGRDAAYDLVRQGRLRSIAVGRKRLVPVVELEAFVERETVSPR